MKKTLAATGAIALLTVVTIAAAPAASSANRWSCSYSPTFNRDWHDDVLCTNGTDSVRPYLRPRDSFVTYGEIMRSARKYERRMNGE